MRDEEKEKLMNMKTHEFIDVCGQMFSCLRVFNGWIYIDKSSNIAVFVPQESNNRVILEHN